MHIGEKFAEAKGQSTSIRVLPDPRYGQKYEVSFQEEGTCLGQAVREMGTYSFVEQPSGALLGEGRGVLHSQNGDAVNWTAIGRGERLSNGNIVWRACLCYTTDSPDFDRLNQSCGLARVEVFPDGKMKSEVNEWR